MATVVRRLPDLPGDRFTEDEPVIALTFDDGPGSLTAAFAEELRRLDAPASFFVVGELAAAHPDTVAALAADGHTIGSHSWSHARIEHIGETDMVDECVRATTRIERITGRPVSLVRVPYRKVPPPRISELLEIRGLLSVGWSVDPCDWDAGDADTIAHRVLSALHPGAIVLLHDGGPDRSATLAALPAIVAGARAAGYRLVAL
ncbi:polysaccharide deacetylase family protein [Rhabdothermincola sp.]|uniref:polysaccharide deacetylase family protein n=1 Tax=Rhabdothermincola sp. TaxID=2820405 RepID=UPI002FE0CD47